MAKKPTGAQKRYRNSGVTELTIEGRVIEPGEEFLATLEDNYEMQMFVGGHLELLEDQSAKADKAQEEGAAEVANGTDTGTRKRSRL